MQYFGYVLITVSFLICSYLTVINEFQVNWGLFIPFLLVGAAGVALARISQQKAAQSEEVVTENIGNLRESLKNIVTNIRQLNLDKSAIDVYDLGQRIDEVFIEDLNTFVEARESIGHAYTLQDYADIMSHYAAGERYLNRVWSASADGYIDETITYIERAQTQFEQALERLNALE